MIDKSLMPVMGPEPRFHASDYRVHPRRTRWRAGGPAKLTDPERAAVEAAERELASLWCNGGAVLRVYSLEKATRAPAVSVPPESDDVLGCLVDLAVNGQLPGALAGCSIEHIALTGMRTLTASEAVTGLFGAYVSGGAYSPGLPEPTAMEVAKGWADVALAQADDRLMAVRALDPGFSGWFARVSWDLAIVVLNPAVGRLTLVCATDTD